MSDEASGIRGGWNVSDELKFESVGTLRYVPTGEHRFPLEGECFRDSTGYQIAHTDFCVNQWPIYRVFNLSFVMERLAFDQLCELSRLRADCKRKDEAIQELEQQVAAAKVVLNMVGKLT